MAGNQSESSATQARAVGSGSVMFQPSGARAPHTSSNRSNPGMDFAAMVRSGPAARSIPGFDRFEEVWDARAPLGWNISDPGPTARACVALLSDWFPATTGEIVHVDGGVHAVGA